MVSTSEWREEVCPECGDDREREWRVELMPTGGRVSKGWQVDQTRGRKSPSWTPICYPTRWATLCACDAT